MRTSRSVAKKVRSCSWPNQLPWSLGLGAKPPTPQSMHASNTRNAGWQDITHVPL